MEAKKFDMEIKTKYTLTQEDIDDILCAALEGGITYWCDSAEVVGEYLGEYASEQISRGGKLLLHDCEDEEVYELTLEKFLNGVKLWIKEGSAAVSANKIDICLIDAVEADIIIQYALFGELVFG